MQDSGIPTKFPIVFASGAAGANITTPIPNTSTTLGRASLTLGFPPACFTPIAAGGSWPFGQDFNGILNETTAWLQWLQAGAPIGYDAAFSTAIGGYPKGASIRAASGTGQYWISTADNNTTDPDTGGAGWVSLASFAFPTGLNTLSATATLTAVNAGTFYNVIGGGITVTLNTATFSAGQTVGFLAENAFTLAASSSTFYGGSLGSVSSVAIPAGSLLALQFDGANWRQLAGSFLAIPTGVQAFATPGTTTTTVPAGVYFILAKIWAGGGGGAGGAPTTGTSFAGTGAGGGGYALKVIPVVPGQTITIVIGEGGTAGPAQSSGGTGGASSIAVNGVTISASGGSGGQYQASFGTFQAAGGIGSGGTENLTGGAGGISQAGPSNNGLGGPGGNGAGGGGQGGVASSAASSPGITPGGGGGGAGGPGALSGGSGANGYAEISY